MGHTQNINSYASSENGEKIISKLVVGADGGKSIVRELSDISTFSWSYEQKAFVSLLRSGKGHENTAWQVFTSTGPIALLPYDKAGNANVSLGISLF